MPAGGVRVIAILSGSAHHVAMREWLTQMIDRQNAGYRRENRFAQRLPGKLAGKNGKILRKISVS
jgi:hypothetical protein